VQKSRSYETTSSPRGAYNTFSAVDKVTHRQKRKVVNQAFTEHSLRELEPVVLKQTNLFLQGLAASSKGSDASIGQWSAPVNLTLWCKYLTLDILGTFSFGKSFDVLTKPDNRFILDAIVAFSFTAGVYLQYPRLAGWNVERPLLWWSGFSPRWDVARFGAIVKDMITERAAKDMDADYDLFALLSDAKDPETGQGFTKDEIWAESRLFTIAGMLQRPFRNFG
jgi:cytochrome P450